MGLERSIAPFFDSSYKPEILYLYEKLLGGEETNWFRLDLQVGLQHESNGKGDPNSRSLNIAHARSLALGRDGNFQFKIQPRIYGYVGDLSDNPDIANYRGYADLRLVAGWQRGLQVSAFGRPGNDGDRGSVQVDATYPLMGWFPRSLSLYLHAQYFTGYGESLLRYNQRDESFRLGFSLFR